MKKEQTTGKLKRDSDTDVFFCAICKSAYFEELLHIVPAWKRKDSSWSICQFLCCCTNKYFCLLERVWLTNILLFSRDLYWPIKFHILYGLTISSAYIYAHISAKERNKNLTWIYIEIAQLAGGAAILNLWTEGGSSVSKESVSFDSGIMY